MLFRSNRFDADTKAAFLDLYSKVDVKADTTVTDETGDSYFKNMTEEVPF